MVRLRLDLSEFGEEHRVEFTIHYGEIKTRTAKTSTAKRADLQSTMVRLRLAEFCLSAHARAQFTIHYGEIKTRATRRNMYFRITFTIHYGEIKTPSAAL